ncbi:hypothetical protein AVEN_132498-1, partial [Araneus ventricosus]
YMKPPAIQLEDQPVLTRYMKYPAIQLEDQSVANQIHSAATDKKRGVSENLLPTLPSPSQGYGCEQIEDDDAGEFAWPSSLAGDKLSSRKSLSAGRKQENGEQDNLHDSQEKAEGISCKMNNSGAPLIIY